MKKEFEEEYVEVNGIAHFLLHYPKAPDARFCCICTAVPAAWNRCSPMRLIRHGVICSPRYTGISAEQEKHFSETKARYAGNNRTDAG